MSQPEILQATENGVAWITLNRPDSLNALNAALLTGLRAALEQAAADDAVRAVVITGAGRGFSSGADLQATGSGGPRDPGRTLREFYHPLIELMRAMPKPIVTAVNGVAAGAGMSIALAGDIVIAGQSATFLQAFSKIGLVPDAGSTWFLPRYAGDVRARALAMLADRISSADALQYGMVWKVYADDALLAEARKMAEYLAKMPTRAYALIKQALNGTYDRTLTDQLELEAKLQTEAVKTEDATEGVKAFVEKRPPNFKGR
ncbi:MAG TPA: enoyl-CoA hydratase-related protein [Burkholderiaceae bacterium]|nr:enoyl-CoA hydratase-related protein [Burkholderiaceae bacterium]